MRVHHSILVAEDKPVILDYWAKALKRAGWVVTTARSGQEAHQRLTEAHFAVVVCDLYLGPGPTALDLLRAFPNRWRETPFVVVTGLGTVSACREAFLLGARDFIAKPVSSEMFVFLVENLSRPSPDGVSALEALAANNGSQGAARVREALMVIDRVALKPKTTVGMVAEAVGVTTDHLTRLFRDHLGRTPLEMIHFLRIKKAADMLPNPHPSIYQVGFECGYTSQNRFEAWFRRAHGMTPSEWRKKCCTGGADATLSGAGEALDL